MSIIVKWYDDSHRILQYSFIDDWTWDDYYSALAEGRTMERTTGHAVCTFNDMRQTTHIPADFIEHARQVSLTRPTSTVISVYISSDYHFVSIYEVLCRLYPDTQALYPLVATEEDALSLVTAWIQAHPIPRT